MQAPVTSTSSSYTEGITCKIPNYLPAANYSVYVCVAAFGCGSYNGTYNVALNLTGVSPASGSTAGGTTLTISGSGFSTNASEVNVTIGGVQCAVRSSNSTTLVCLTGAAPAGVRRSRSLLAATSYDVLVTPSAGALTFAVPSQQFLYDPTLTPAVTAMSPTRGSTAGGTLLNFTCSNSFTAAPTVMIGTFPCQSVTLGSSGTWFTCLTQAPASRPAGPLAVTVSVTGFGNAAQPAGLTYTYVDLWSHSSTWGGSSPPGEGDSVVVPPGVIVLLDVSPPPLYVVRGCLHCLGLAAC